MTAMTLNRCDVLFSSHTSALALWTCFAHLVDLTFVECDALVYDQKTSSNPGPGIPEEAINAVVIPHHLKLSSAANHPFLPCLESLRIQSFGGLSHFANLPPTIKIFNITNCRSLKSLGSCLGELRSLEELRLYNCRSLTSLTDRPQAYSSLKVLKINYCKKK